MIKEVIDSAIQHKKSVIVKSEEPLCDGNNTLSNLCSFYPKLTVISPILPAHAEYVFNKLSHHKEPVIVVISEFLNRDIINKVCEYAFNQSVIFLVDDDSPALDAAFSDKCVKFSI